ncbi:MAG TPA: bifunctional DNA primase/polymerase [Kineosporiaceae bacterium]|nr:bifunctional DNA primase/polymerase [Kineosporiaceae bacterium]
MTTEPSRLATPEPEQLLEAALQRAAAGHPVFPCVPAGKRPLTSHGLLDASTDENQIRAWWRKTPTANLAVPTGVASYDVLDVDLRPSGSGYPAFHQLLRAGLLDTHSHAVLTPSGGMHAYFTGTEQPSARLPAQHLDFKATGGYVLAPPSVVGGRTYELLHRTPGPHGPLHWAAVRELLAPAAVARPTRQIGTVTIEPLARWVSQLPEGQRNAGTFWAACRAAENDILDLRPLVDAAVAAGLPRREALRTITSAIRHTGHPDPPS